MNTQIPVRNIYYMLCYAWDLLHEKEEMKVSEMAGFDAYNLLARVFANGVRRLLKRGLGKAYSLMEDDLQCLRGKIDFRSSIKYRTLRQNRLICQYDEMDDNMLFNRIIKATLSLLLRHKELGIPNRNAIHQCSRFFTGIQDIKLSQDIFSGFRFNRSNAHYEMVIRICEVIFRNAAIDERTGHVVFKDFERDKQMWKLFELFVFNFYKRHIGDRYDVFHGKQVPWAVDEGKQGSGFLPAMITDTIVDDKNRRLIIDTKYYADAILEKYENSLKFRSQHLYQIYSYVRNSEAIVSAGKRVDGVLLYPRVEQMVDIDCEIQGHRISVKMVDMNAEWETIHKRLLEIVGVADGEQTVPVLSC